MTRAVVACALTFIVAGPSRAGALEVATFTIANGLPSNWVTALAFAPDGTLWVGTGDAGIFRLDPSSGAVKAYRAADGLASDSVTSVALFQGKLYVGTTAGLSAFDGISWSRQTSAGNVTMRNVRLASSPDGKELWACSVYLNGGTVRFDGKSWTFMGGDGRGLFNDIQGFAFLPDGVLMASNAGVPYLHKVSDVVPLSAGLPPASIYSASFLKGKGLIGTSRGLFEFDKSWRSVALPGASGRVSVFALAAAGDAAYVASSAGLFRYDGRKAAVLEGVSIPDSRITAVAASDGSVAAGTAKGLAVIRGW